MTVKSDVIYRDRMQGRNQIEEADLGFDWTQKAARTKVGDLVTSDATATLVEDVEVKELQAVLVVAKAVGRVPGGSGVHYAGGIAGLFKRETGGDVTIVGSTQTLFTAITDGNLTGLTMVANTANETVDVKVTGSASTTCNWHVTLEVVRIRTSS